MQATNQELVSTEEGRALLTHLDPFPGQREWTRTPGDEGCQGMQIGRMAADPGGAARTDLPSRGIGNLGEIV